MKGILMGGANLAIELINGKFSGVSSDNPTAFTDTNIMVINRTSPEAEAVENPLDAFDLSAATLASVDTDDTEPADAGIIEVQETSWALQAMIDFLADGDDEASAVDASGDDDAVEDEAA